MAAIWDPETTALVVTTATSQGLGDEMDEPMQDVCTDPIKDGAEETQYVSVEIDTQATDGYDDGLLDEEVLKQISDRALRAPPVSNLEPRYMVPLDQDEPGPGFKFGKPAHITPIFRPARPSAGATTAPSRSGLNPPSEICSGAQQESRRKNPGDFAKTTLTIFQRTIQQMSPLQLGKPRRSLQLPLKTTRQN